MSEMLKSTLDKIYNAVNGIYYYGCHCCMTKRDKPKYRRRLRSKLKDILLKEVNEERQAGDGNN